VALGLLAAVRLSVQIFGLSHEYEDRLKSLLVKLGLPVKLEGISPNEVLAAMTGDKKADDASINMVLLQNLGEPVLNCNVEAGMLRREVERLNA
jgi:3-dehydroquinate synthase